MKIIEQLAPRRHRKRQSPVSFSAVILIYLMRIVAGLNFFYHIGPVLLRSQSLMHLVGFNGREIEQGVNRRSLDKSSTNRKDKNNTEIRGPVCPEFIASFIVAIAGKTIERVFNKVEIFRNCYSDHRDLKPVLDMITRRARHIKMFGQTLIVVLDWIENKKHREAAIKFCRLLNQKTITMVGRLRLKLAFYVSKYPHHGSGEAQAKAAMHNLK